MTLAAIYKGRSFGKFAFLKLLVYIKRGVIRPFGCDWRFYEKFFVAGFGVCRNARSLFLLCRDLGKSVCK